MEEFLVARDNKPFLRFVGEMLAVVENPTAKVRYTLYRTKGGQYVGQKEENDPAVEEARWTSAAVCKNVEEVYNFFGMLKTAMKLYEKAGILPVEDVE